MLNKILCVMFLGAFAVLGSVEAQTPPDAPTRVKGKILVARVQGGATVVAKSGGTPQSLASGQYIAEGTEVVTSSGSSVVLVFQNGAQVNVSANSVLDIDQFEMDPFAGDVKVADLKAEPTTSKTKLSLARGELVGKVAHLNIDRGSEFTVQTPVGAAGIRGTTFRIVFTPSADGKSFTFSLTTADGTVLYSSPKINQPLNVPSGKQVVMTFDLSNVSGQLLSTTPAAVVNTPPDDAAAVAAEAQVIATAVAPVVIPASDVSNGSTTGGSTTGNTPAPAVVQPPTTTSTAGSGA